MFFSKVTKIFAVLGAFPVLLIGMLPGDYFISAQFIALIYTMMVVSFIAGIDWIIALQTQWLSLLVWSVVATLFAAFILILYYYFELNLLALWSLTLVLFWCQLSVDRLLVKKELLTSEHLLPRVFGTIAMSAMIIGMMVRLFMGGVY